MFYCGELHAFLSYTLSVCRLLFLTDKAEPLLGYFVWNCVEMANLLIIGRYKEKAPIQPACWF